MLRVAITGGLACGKTLVGSCFAARGIPVCDADELGHKAIRRGTAAYRRIVRRFGKRVIGEDGEIDRRKLGGIVFQNPAGMKALNAIVHPEVKKAWKAWTRRHERGHMVCAVMIPLLYEVGDEANWDKVVCVGARESDQVSRLKKRGFSPREIQLRLAAQMPVHGKMERADYVIYSVGSMKVLEEQSVRVLNELLLESQHA